MLWKMADIAQICAISAIIMLLTHSKVLQKVYNIANIVWKAHHCSIVFTRIKMLYIHYLRLAKPKELL